MNKKTLYINESRVERHREKRRVKRNATVLGLAKWVVRLVLALPKIAEVIEKYLG